MAIRILFGIIASLGILCALGTVLTRNLVHAALFLVAFFFVVACQFVLLEAEFVAAMQVLVYIGAVAVLLMFGIMLTRNIRGDETTGGGLFRKLPGLVAGVAVLLILTTAIGDHRGTARPGPGGTDWTGIRERPTLDPSDARTRARYEAVTDMSRHVGRELMTRFAIPFEVAGLLLTAAVVGAIAVARYDKQDEETEAPGRAVRTAATGGPTNGSPATTAAPTGSMRS